MIPLLGGGVLGMGANLDEERVLQWTRGRSISVTLNVFGFVF